MSEQELLKCPFCGGFAEVIEYGVTGNFEVVQCVSCGAEKVAGRAA